MRRKRGSGREVESRFATSMVKVKEEEEVGRKKGGGVQQISSVDGEINGGKGKREGRQWQRICIAGWQHWCRSCVWKGGERKNKREEKKKKVCKSMGPTVLN
jgi:hypothetical protein